MRPLEEDEEEEEKEEIIETSRNFEVKFLSEKWRLEKFSKNWKSFLTNWCSLGDFNSWKLGDYNGELKWKLKNPMET